jgi:hypothetical protein
LGSNNQYYRKKYKLDTAKRAKQDSDDIRTYTLVGQMPANMRPRNVDVLGLTKKELADYTKEKASKEAKKQKETAKKQKKEGKASSAGGKSGGNSKKR